MGTHTSNFWNTSFPNIQWKNHHQNRHISQFVQTSLEAFIVIVYCNAYNEWHNRFYDPNREKNNNQDSEQGDMSTITNGTPRGERRHYRFTSNAIGSPKYGGWDEDGIEMYDLIQRKIVQQRKINRTGQEFERKLLLIFNSNKRKLRGHHMTGTIKRPRNDLEDLLTQMKKKQNSDNEEETSEEEQDYEDDKDDDKQEDGNRK